jgi:hypothetical protein
VEYRLFKQRFHDAAARARDFARRYLEEPLPEALSFHLYLNQSVDLYASSDFKLFPEDSSEVHAVKLKHLSAEEVLATLWREGLVPQWVNLTVVGETGNTTLIEVLACGRFIGDEARLYHADEGYAPFHVLGPTFPVDYVEGNLSAFTNDQHAGP